MTKVDIISGFLGAGKTTFIKELISKVYSGEKMVLIENEFGEIGVDSRFMQDAGIEVTEMNSGCICCTLVGDFARALKQVVDTYHPDRIIIEPSGVGKLSDVAKAVSDMQEDAQIEVDSLITVVDGKKAKMYMKNFGEFFDNQIEYANTIVLSRTQMMDEAKLKECIELLREKNEEAAIVTTEWDKLSGDMIKAALEQGHDLKKEMMELISHMHHEHHDHEHHHDHDHEQHHDHDHGHHHHDHEHDHDHEEHEHHDHEHHHDHGADCTCGCHDHDHEEHHHDHEHEHHHHADEVFTSWGIETVHKFSRAELEDLLKLLSMTQDFGTVLRAKGIVQTEEGGWLEFDMVPEETEIRDCKPDYIGRICVIGTELKKDELEKVFAK
ncbi:GTP-binding protein [Clostridiales Family XIII bacterium BX16]|uniref:GTP-binding protein n=1 Tax=Lentihominibacter faecis TaxID=2764712 RepID=A0A923SRD3_9FIRM|nr:CobW family GTP-binding protein [Lentihominibacter faecis]MBC5999290.1 GTP-binding protein [Lentihominibacter faecis]